jgi:hypothetical protein
MDPNDKDVLDKIANELLLHAGGGYGIIPGALRTVIDYEQLAVVLRLAGQDAAASDATMVADAIRVAHAAANRIRDRHENDAPKKEE